MSIQYKHITYVLIIILTYGIIGNCRDDKSTNTTDNCGINVPKLHQPCNTTDDCDIGQDCRIIDKNQKTCEMYCNIESDCPQGYFCNTGYKDWNPHACFNRTKLHEPCTSKSDCCDGQDCIILPSTSGDQKTCEIYCNSDSDCPIGYLCNVCPEGKLCIWDPHRCELK